MRAEIRSLTGLRGIAACWVVLGHYQMDGWSEQWLDRMLVNKFHLAVDIFLILSGFVLAMTYEKRFTAPVAAGQLGRFLQQRLARIYPLYALTTLVCFVLIVFGWKARETGNLAASFPLAIIANLALVQSWTTVIENLNGPAWSLSTEWTCNVMFGVLSLLLLGVSKRCAAWVALGTVAIMVGMSLLASQLFPGRMLPGDMNFIDFPYAIFRCLTEFSLGMYAWRLRSRSPVVAVLGTPWAMALMSACLLLAALLTTDGFELDVLFVLCAVGFVIGMSFEQSWISRALGAPLLHWLGTISYSIYLWHVPVASARDGLINQLTRVSSGHPRVIATLACMALTLLISSASYYWYEKPSRTWLRRVFHMDPARPALVVG